MPVKPTPPVDVLRGAIAVNRGTRGDLDVHMHVYDAERLLRHIEAVEAERDELASTLQLLYEANDRGSNAQALGTALRHARRVLRPTGREGRGE